jgi:hypothetical protein
MLMLEATTSDSALLPTIKHFIDLMFSLESQCQLADFSDMVYGYNSIINGWSCEKGPQFDEADRDPVLRHSKRAGSSGSGHSVSYINMEVGACVT